MTAKEIKHGAKAREPLESEGVTYGIACFYPNFPKADTSRAITAGKFKYYRQKKLRESSRELIVYYYFDRVETTSANKVGKGNSSCLKAIPITR